MIVRETLNWVGRLSIVTALIILCLAVFINISAVEKNYYPQADYYDLDESSEYNCSDITSVTSHYYGDAIGKIKVSGDVAAETSFRGNKAFSVNGN